MENLSEPRVWRIQRNYSLPFKLAVVGAVGRSEHSHQQAQRRYSIHGRRTVLTWCRRDATHFATFQAAGPASSAVDPTPEQRIKQCRTPPIELRLPTLPCWGIFEVNNVPRCDSNGRPVPWGMAW